MISFMSSLTEGTIGDDQIFGVVNNVGLLRGATKLLGHGEPTLGRSISSSNRELLDEFEDANSEEPG